MADFNQEHIRQFRFKQLFNELGWDLPQQQQPYTVALTADAWQLEVVAVKKGVQILHCLPNTEGALPDYATRQKIERKVTADVREHLIVFTDAAKTTQVWQWVNRAQGKTAQYREVHFRGGEAPELLTQKLSRLKFTLDDEELLTVLGVTARMDDAAPRERVTKKFYTEFEKQRKAFAVFIDGIPDMEDHLRWYTAVLIDRLMFLWFLQEKGFLDNNKTYLQARLEKHLAADSGVTFYKSFLCPLFFRGFAQERNDTNRTAIAAEFGNVPYLNGGLFAQHELEHAYGAALDVHDTAFSKLFAFFDEWEWHLDERPLKSGKEINPDVLGYIFEKFVNQKQMGAYYTKEDITDYIGKNTIIPCLLSKVRVEHPTAFDAIAWPLLQTSGDAYIYPAMLKGVDVPYPPEIELGMDTEAPDLLTRRKPWNKRADDAVSLPTEIWRETIARHQRTREIRAKLAAGEVSNVGDLITYNLDIRQFAQDLIERCTDVALLKSFWFNLAGRLPRKSNEKFRHGLSVLDPTCGSGAFLFAALGILKPLYDATLRTLQAVRTDALIAGEKSSPEKWAEVDELLLRFAAAGSERAQDYAVIKHIIVNNLYGVDIEKQATEIAKLRLFLKLVALLEPGDAIEPLPDIDFNIRHGNTLVGYATADETEKAVKGATQGNLFSDAWEDIRIRLLAVEQQYNNFQIQQVQRGGHVSAQDKQALAATLAELEEMLNYHLAREYGVNTTKTKDFAAWKSSHQPFHWYVDFYPLMAGGGFDAIIGNPPYIEYSKVRSDYVIKAPKIDVSSGNLYAFTTERCLDLLQRCGAMGLIIPVSFVSTQRMAGLQSKLSGDSSVWLSSYGERPAKLFTGAEVLLTIAIAHRGAPKSVRYVTGLRKWSTEQRDGLFPTTCYVDKVNSLRGFVIPKFASSIEKSIFSKMWASATRLSNAIQRNSGNELFYRIGGGRYWKIFTIVAPKFVLNGKDTKSSRENSLLFNTTKERDVASALLSSSTFFWLFSVTTNGRDLNPIDLHDFPVDLNLLNLKCPSLIGLTDLLMADYQHHSQMRIKESAQTGTVEYQEFYPRLSKQIIDRIDAELQRFYDLSDEELDYIINYDIKYRMGQAGEDTDD